MTLPEDEGHRARVRPDLLKVVPFIPMTTPPTAQVRDDAAGSHPPDRPEAVLQELAYLQSILDSVREPLLVLTPELRVRTAN
jgi:hypothetical protein